MDAGTLVVAGGANFPDGLPWEGGEKVYQKAIFTLRVQADGDTTWQVAGQLPLAAAYGAAVSTRYGLWCLGGMDTEHCLSETWFIRVNPENSKVSVLPGPPLPLPMAHFAAAVVDEQLYLAGGVTSPAGPAGSYFFSMDLRPDSSSWEWKTLPSWAGGPRALAVAAAQSDGRENCFYLFSGRDFGPDRPTNVWDDGFVYHPQAGNWENLAREGQHFPVMAGTAFALGSSHIVFSSGDAGELMLQAQTIQTEIQAFELQKNALLSSPKRDSLEQVIAGLQAKLRTQLDTHPGFGRQTWLFHTLTRRLTRGPDFPAPGPVTTTAVRWGETIVIPSGEIRPGVRSPAVWQAHFSPGSHQLGAADYAVIAVYFLLLAVMGYYFSTKQHDTRDYFRGGERIPWWAAGLSIFGTGLSAITFMAIPAKTYSTDWAYYLLGLTIFGVAPLIAGFFVPFYRRLHITSAYEYLEIRFNLAVRILGSLSFMLFQVGRMGIVLYLPALALHVVSGADIFLSIGLMAIVSLIYTLMGGIEAVIWTDVIQVFVLMGGAMLSLLLMVLAIDGGLSGIIETGIEEAKFGIFDLDLSLREPTLWVVVIGGLFINLTTYGTDQTIVQRYLTTRDIPTAKRTVWTNGWLSIVSTTLFFLLGTALFVLYRQFPAQLNPGLPNHDAIFPWYIVSQLPAGVSGLLIAGIFAAAMSSLSSSMNSVAAAYSIDIHTRFGFRSGRSELAVARWATLVAGLAGTFFALLMATSDIQSLWDEFQKILGLILGSLGGVFLLGMLIRRANGPGALIGIGLSVGTQYLVALYQPVHLLLYSATGVISCFLLGWLASLFFPAPNREHFTEQQQDKQPPA